MNNLKNNQKALLLLGLAGAAVTMVGDFLLWGVSTPGAQSMLDSLLMAAQRVSYTRIGLAAFFGYVGIPVSVLGYFALCGMCTEKNSRLYRVFRASTVLFGVLGGGIHVMCCFIETGLKKNMETGLAGTDTLMAVLREQAGYLVPSMAVFFAAYLVFGVSSILLIAKRKTTLPAWAALINPFTMKIMLNGTRLLGYSAFANGLGCSNMSFGAIVIFTVWLLLEKKNRAAQAQ